MVIVFGVFGAAGARPGTANGYLASARSDFSPRPTESAGASHPVARSLANPTVVGDTTPPTGTVAIVADGASTNSAMLSLNLTASDDSGGSGVKRVRLSNSPLKSNGVLRSGSTRAYRTTMTWSIADPAFEGSAVNGTRTVYAQWQDAAGNWSTVRSAQIVFDTLRPSVIPPSVSLPNGATLGSSSIPLRLRWSGSDATSGIARYTLDQSTGGGPYTDVSLPTARSAGLTPLLQPDHGYRFRTRTSDRAGNERWAYGPAFTLRAEQETSPAISYAGDWSTATPGNAYGGSLLHASAAGAAAAFSFEGRSIAWVAGRGPDRGQAEIWLDGATAGTVDLYAASAAQRRIVWSTTFAGDGPHTLEIRVLGSGRDVSSGTRVDLDALVIVAPPVPQAPADATLQEPPDVVVVMVDDVPALDDRLWQFLPNIRETFVEQGTQFTDFHGETPRCCPGRAGFLTGQHTFNHGVNDNRADLFRPDMSLATQLQEVGYHTFLTGKYYNRYELLGPAVPAGWDRFHAFSDARYYDYRLWNNGSPTPERHARTAADYSTDVLAARALRALRAAPPDRPVFAWITVYSGHEVLTPAPRHATDGSCGAIRPWAPPNYNELDVRDKPSYVRSAILLKASAQDLRPLCRTLLSVDEMVGALRDELAVQGRLENTIFVFTSDNGMNYGAHRLVGKSRPYATQIPFFVSWPGGLGRGPRLVGERIQNIDFAPTICELTGCTMGPYPNGQATADGLSFAALLRGTADSLERDAVIANSPAGPWQPYWYAVTTTAASPLAAQGCSAAATGACRWHYVEYDNGERELYDLSGGPCWAWSPRMAGDPCRLENRAGQPDYAEIETALQVRLAELKLERGRPQT